MHSTDEKAPILSVRELNHAAKSLLEGHFPSLWVEGELTNLVCHSSGHWYFSLKDEHAQVRCAMFRGFNRLLSFTPQSGMTVLARAKVSLYEGRGDFQLIVEFLEEAGFGALQRAFEALKKKLEKEGLFDPRHKKPIPVLPRCIGVITSPTGAAVRDILSTLKRRFPSIPVIIYPCLVQGKEAATSICHALALANQRQECDVLIVARGGGSLEDLWPFNEEIVARAIFASTVPVVSGVGHEIDFTIADFVASERAATPTAAAELCCPSVLEWQAQLKQWQRRLFLQFSQHLQYQIQRLQLLQQRLKHPGQRLQELMQRIDHLEQRLQKGIEQHLMICGHRFQQQKQMLFHESPLKHIVQQHHVQQALTQRLMTLVQQRLSLYQQRFIHLTSALDAMSPLATLHRGYAILRKENGVLLRESHAVNLGDKVKATLYEGSLVCEVVSKV